MNLNMFSSPGNLYSGGEGGGAENNIPKIRHRMTYQDLITR